MEWPQNGLIIILYLSIYTYFVKLEVSIFVISCIGNFYHLSAPLYETPRNIAFY